MASVCKTNEQFVNEVTKKFPNIQVLGNYKDCHTEMKFRCLIHDYEFCKKPILFLNSRHGCNLCARENTKKSLLKSPQWFKSELSEKNPNVIQISEYVNMSTKVKVKCVYCGKIFDSKAQDLLNGHFCRECSIRMFADSRKLDKEEIENRIKQYNPYYGTFDIIGNCSGMYEEVDCICKKCGYKWSTKASNLIDKRGGTGCPTCNNSKGEMFVKNYLTNKNVHFICQKQKII